MVERRKRPNAGDENKKKRRRVSSENDENSEEQPQIQQPQSEAVQENVEEGQEPRSVSTAPPDLSEDLMNMFIPERPDPTMSTDPDAPRLIISKIVVENFKSYYGKQILGPFHKNFTSILGPNGSGKSNVIDSLLFVFGFRANKVRSKKVSCLIHNSSAHPDVRSCTVAVHFAKIIDKGTNHEVQPGSEFFVSRTVTKSGSSSYHINGKPSNTNDVRNTLKSNGIDLDHNRFLILQGEVEQISLMKPKRSERSEEDGMLEYLEDIIGSSRLKDPIEKFRRRIEYYNNEEEMIQKRLKLASTEVETLKGPVIEIVRLMRVENSITTCKYKLRSIDRLELTERSDAAKATFDKLKQHLTTAEHNLRECNNEIKKQQKNKAKLITEESDLKEKLDEVDRKRQDAQREEHKTNEEIVRIENRKAKKESEIKKERKNLEKAESAPGDAQELITKCDEEKERCETEISECEDQLKDLRAKEREANQATRDELNEIMPQITTLSTDENAADSKLSLAKDKLDRILNAANDPRNQLKAAEERARKVESELSDTQSQLEQITNRIPQLTDEIKTQNETCQAQRAKEGELIDKTNKLQRELESNKVEANANNSNSAALNGLMREKQSGRIDGILGRLGDLGGIDQRYDVAISTCCPALENVLVDTVETAQQCIGFLKDNNLARMTFIALDKQQHLWDKVNKKPNTPEDAPRLIDLITVSDKKVMPAFYSVLRDTLFANNIEDATRISNKDGVRWRIVTARGELVEPSGTMTGGGRREIKGRMGKKVRVDTSQNTTERDWRQLEKEVKDLRDETNRVRLELSKNMDQLKHQNEELQRLTQEERKLNQNIPKIQRQVERAQKEVSDACNAVQTTAVDETEINQLRSEIEQFEKEKEAVCGRGSALRKTKEKLDVQIKKVEDKILGKTRDRLAQLRVELKKVEEECNKAQLTLKNSSSTIEKIRKAIKNSENAVQTAQDELVSANASVANLKNKIENYLLQKEQYQERLESASSEIVAATQRLEDLGKQEAEFHQQIEEQKRGIAGAEGQMTDLMDKLSNVEAEIGKLSLYTIRSDIVLPTIQASKRRSSRPSGTNLDSSIQSIDPDATIQQIDPDTTIQHVDPDTTIQNDSERPTGNESGFNSTENEQPTGANSTEGPSQEIANTGIDENLGREIDEQTEELANTTMFTTAFGDATHNPAYDMGNLPIYTTDQTRALNRDEIRLQLQAQEKRRLKFKIKMNLALIEEYADKMERQLEVEGEMEKLKEVFGKHRKRWLELTQKRNDEFNDGFQKICLATQEIYQMITLGGDAMLEKVNSMDTFNEGITFQVRPPKKTWKQITNLSGGEKTLASLALVFGLHTYRPTPLYVMDEIDAALDYRNVSIISTYLKERTKNAQFIIISLRNNMFENGDRLIGIFKVRDCTQNVVYDTECLDDSDSDEQ